jgi:hypothetical protein
MQKYTEGSRPVLGCEVFAYTECMVLQAKALKEGETGIIATEPDPRKTWRFGS